MLDALRAQTLPQDQWELLLIDNASRESLAGQWDISWHLNSRLIREDELGLTPARLRGIAEARGTLLIFVDDDNVLRPTYLEHAVQISDSWAVLGAWGGTIIAEYEVEPEPWVQPLLKYLAIREFARPVWSNNPEDWRAQPCGAGMCVRATVAKEYALRVSSEPVRRMLGRIGQSLSSCEDSDLIQTSCDLAMGFGNFPELTLIHLIPRSRVEKNYLIHLLTGIRTSGILLGYCRSGTIPSEPNVLKVWVRYALIFLRQGSREACIYRASQEGIKIGIRIVQNLAKS